MTLDDLDAETGELAEMVATNAIADAQRNPVDPRDLKLRHSRLATFAKSGAHYLEACQEQDEDDSIATRLGSAFAEDKKAIQWFGSGVHGMLLGKPVGIVPATNRNGKRMARNEAHEEYREFKAKCDARGCVSILNPREYVEAQSIADAIKRKELAMRALFDGTILEDTILFDFCGRASRATPDARGKRKLVELKTTRSSDPRWFRRDVLTYHYASQLAFYDEAHPSDEHLIVAVEKSRPYCVTVFRVEPSMLELGKRQIRLWVEQLLVCEASGMYPEYASSIVPIEMDEQEGWAA